MISSKAVGSIALVVICLTGFYVFKQRNRVLGSYTGRVCTPISLVIMKLRSGC